MKHRHINTKSWTQEALDSLFERGDLPDWLELKRAAIRKPSILIEFTKCAKRHPENENWSRIFVEVCQEEIDAKKPKK